MLLNRKYNFISTTMTQITNWHLKSIIILFLQSAYVSQSGSLQDVRWFSPPETFWTLVFEAFQILFVLLMIMQLGGHRRSDLDVTGRTKLLQHRAFPRILVSKPGILPRVMSWTKTASSFSDGRLQSESELIEHIVGYLADRPPESDISSTPAKEKLLQDIYKRGLQICYLSGVKLSLG